MTKKRKVSKEVLIAVVAALTIIEVVAMFKGINGKLFSLIAVLIGAIGGISVKDLITIKN